MFVGVNFGHNMTKAYLPETKRRKIKNFFIHPNYEMVVGVPVPSNSKRDFFNLSSSKVQPTKHDIALVEIEEHFKLGDDIYPACLIEQDFDEFDDNFIIAGYGTEIYVPISRWAFNFSKSTKIKSNGIEITLFNKDELKMVFYKQSSDCSKYFINYTITDSICAVGESNSSIHFGDSGSALLYPFSNSLVIAGITSMATNLNFSDFIFDNKSFIESGNKTVNFYMRVNRSYHFTRIYPHLEWIDKYLNKNRCTSSGFELDYKKLMLLTLIILTLAASGFSIYYY